MNAKELLRIKKLRVEFPSRRGTFVAVDDIDLDVARGEIHGLVGESGAGKSTVGNAIMDLLEPPGRIAGGEIWLDGKRIDAMDASTMRMLRGRKVGMIFQDPLTSLNPLLTVEQQLVETMLLHLNMDEGEAKKQAVGLLEQVGIPMPAERIKQYPHQFSGGMRQRVVIALALCSNPDLIIADEPTTALDVSIQSQILELIKRLCRERELGVILITHDIGVIAETSDRVAVMYRGRVVERGTTAQVLHAPAHDYTRALISAVPRPDVRLDRFPNVSYIEDNGRGHVPIDISNHWLGRFDANERHRGELTKVDALCMDFVLKRSILPKRRRYLTAVDNVSFAVKAGEVFGLVGESGSGKSTVARIISGIYQPTGGRVFYAGSDLTAERRAGSKRSHRRHIQMIFQDPFSSLNPRMRVRKIIAEPMLFHHLVATRAEANDVVDDLLEHVGLGREAGLKFPHEFSGGQRQRISIARALATRPRLLICDEPTSALDVSIQAQILNLLKDLQEELDLTMLFISHDLPVIRQMCDRVGVMQGGQLLEVAPTEQLFEEPQHAHTRELMRLMPRLDSLARPQI
jgi:peptide/nickel transport system ATP-binding protein